MFSRSSKLKKKVATKPATIKIIKPEQSKVERPVLDLSKAKIAIIKPEPGLRVMVENEGEDE